MTFEEKFPTVVNEEGADYDLGVEPGETGDDNLSGDEELLKAIQSLKDSEDDEDEDETDESDEESDEDDESDEEESDEDEDPEEDEEDEERDQEPEEKPKKKQSKEENAKFAAQRRQKEMEAKIQAEVDKLRNESPEFQLAKQLSEVYGKDPATIMEEMREAQLRQEAKDKNLPIELLRERQKDQSRIQTLEDQLNQIRFESWQNKIKADSADLKGKYTMLTDEDFDSAVDYMLNTVKNVDLPLEQAVYAVHGQKIIDSLANQKVQDKLATESGRKKKTPLAPSNGKPASPTKSLTAEEKAIAKAFNMSEADYLKYKS